MHDMSDTPRIARIHLDSDALPVCIPETSSVDEPTIIRLRGQPDSVTATYVGHALTDLQQVMATEPSGDQYCVFVGSHRASECDRCQQLQAAAARLGSDRSAPPVETAGEDLLPEIPAIASRDDLVSMCQRFYQWQLERWVSSDEDMTHRWFVVDYPHSPLGLSMDFLGRWLDKASDTGALRRWLRLAASYIDARMREIKEIEGARENLRSRISETWVWQDTQRSEREIRRHTLPYRLTSARLGAELTVLTDGLLAC